MILLALAALSSDIHIQGEPISMAIAGDGMIAVGQENGFVQLFDSAGREKASFIEKGRVTALTFSPDGQRLATGFRDEGQDVTTGIWSREGRNVRYFDAFKRQPPSPKDPMRIYSFVTTYAVAWSPDGKYIAAEHGGHLNTGVRVWDMQGHLVSDLGRNAKVAPGLRSPMAAGVKSVEFAPDGRSIMTSMDDGYVRLWNLDGSLSWERNVSALDTAIADFSADGRQIVWGTTWQDRLVGAMDATTGKVLWSRSLPNYPVAVRSLSGDRLLASFGNKIGIVSRSAGRSNIRLVDSAVALSLSDDRKWMVALTKNGDLIRRKIP